MTESPCPRTLLFDLQDWFLNTSSKRLRRKRGKTPRKPLVRVLRICFRWIISNVIVFGNPYIGSVENIKSDPVSTTQRKCSYGSSWLIRTSINNLQYYYRSVQKKSSWLRRLRWRNKRQMHANKRLNQPATQQHRRIRIELNGNVSHSFNESWGLIPILYPVSVFPNDSYHPQYCTSHNTDTNNHAGDVLFRNTSLRNITRLPCLECLKLLQAFHLACSQMRIKHSVESRLSTIKAQHAVMDVAAEGDSGGAMARTHLDPWHELSLCRPSCRVFSVLIYWNIVHDY